MSSITPQIVTVLPVMITVPGWAMMLPTAPGVELI
jgi:hypothetical protein